MDLTVPDSPAPAPDTTGGELRDAIAEILPALRDLLAERDTLAAQVRAVEAEVEAWGDASREWYHEHRYDSGGTTYACGFEDGWNHAEECVRRALGTPTTGGGE